MDSSWRFSRISQRTTDSTAHGHNPPVHEINDELKESGEWAQQWKKIFNIDPSKNAEKIIIFPQRKTQSR